MNHSRRRRRCRDIFLVFLVGGGLLFASIAPAGQVLDASLPEPKAFLQRVREHMASDRLLLSQYTFIAKQTRTEIGEPGRVETQVYRVYPAVDPDRTYRQLLVVDGEPLSAEKLEQQDRKRREEQAKWARRLAREGVSEQEKRLQQDTEARREEQELFDDILTLYDFELVRREVLRGHPTILVSFTPRRGVKPRTGMGKMARKARGHAWVSEAEYKIVRLDAEIIEDITVGLGLIGRLHKGSTVALRYRKVNGEIWLPAEMHFSASGRALLFRTFRFETRTEYSDFRKATEEESRPAPAAALSPP